LLNKDSDNSMEEEVNVEAECKNCNHEIRLHTPRCGKQDHYRMCGCERPQYYGAVVSNIMWAGQNFIATGLKPNFNCD
jgi:hypothetical protein